MKTLFLLAIICSLGFPALAAPQCNKNISLQPGTGYVNIEITGQTARELYKRLKVETEKYETKFGENIICEVHLKETDNHGGMQATHICTMSMSTANGQITAGPIVEESEGLLQ